jgi:hypothetical protein
MDHPNPHDLELGRRAFADEELRDLFAPDALARYTPEAGQTVFPPRLELHCMSEDGRRDLIVCMLADPRFGDDQARWPFMREVGMQVFHPGRAPVCLVLASEVWTRPFTVEEEAARCGRVPADYPDRLEAVGVFAQTIDGRWGRAQCPLTRQGGLPPPTTPITHAGPWQVELWETSTATRVRFDILEQVWAGYGFAVQHYRQG